MSQICRRVTLFALMLQLALSTQARLEPASAPVVVEETAENDDTLYYAPSPYGDDKWAESPYPLDDMASELEGYDGQYPPSPSSYSPGIEQDYPYNGEYPSPSPSPSPSPYINVMAPEVDDLYDDDYSSSEAPSTTGSGSSMAAPPPAEWEYRAEDDAGYFSSGEDEEGYGEANRRGTIGFVIGAVCLVGLGGLVYKRRKANQKRKHPVYLELSRTGDD